MNRPSKLFCELVLLQDLKIGIEDESDYGTGHLAPASA